MIENSNGNVVPLEERDQWKRQLVAIFIADIVEFSRLMGDDESQTYEQMHEHRKSTIDLNIDAYKGNITKSTGDGLLAHFPSVTDAVRCAISIQKELASKNKIIPEHRRMFWRIGINFGDVIVESDDIFGNDVNITARLESLAEPGGICISERVYNDVRNKVDTKFHSLGQQWLKNIIEPIHIYRSDSELDTSSTRRSTEGIAEQGPHEILDRPSIAILPFTNLIPNQKKQYLVDGITEDLTTNFSMSPEFFVISKVSAFSFNPGVDNLNDIAKKLGVRYMVTGSVQQDRERFRVTTQLIDANEGLQLWAGRFNRENAELFKIRDEITSSIAATLMATDGQIAKAELRRQTQKSPEKFSVYDHYLKGRDLLHKSIMPPWEAGKKYSEMAKLEFEYAIANSQASDLPLHAGLAWQYAIDFDWEYGDPKKSLQLAFDNAVVAVNRWPDNHLAHWVMGWAYLFAKKDYDHAMFHYNRARELNVGDSRLLAEMAQPLIYIGEYQRAIDLLKQAIRLNPLHEQWYDEFLAWAYEEIGKPEKSIDLLKKFSSLEGISGYGVMARACVATGQVERFQGLIGIMDKLSRTQTGTPFSLDFWSRWVQQKEPYQDSKRADRVINIIAEGLEKINWGR